MTTETINQMRAALGKLQALRAAHPHTAEWADAEILTLEREIEDATHAHGQGMVGAIDWRYPAGWVATLLAIVVAGALVLSGAR